MSKAKCLAFAKRLVTVMADGGRVVLDFQPEYLAGKIVYGPVVCTFETHERTIRLETDEGTFSPDFADDIGGKLNQYTRRTMHVAHHGADDVLAKIKTMLGCVDAGTVLEKEESRRFHVYARWLTKSGKMATHDCEIFAINRDTAMKSVELMIMNDKRRRYAGGLDTMCREVKP